MIQLTDQEFYGLVKFIRMHYGIDLSKKRLLIEARMYSVLYEKHLFSFSQYFEILKHDSSELNTLQ